MVFGFRHVDVAAGFFDRQARDVFFLFFLALERAVRRALAGQLFLKGAFVAVGVDRALVRVADQHPTGGGVNRDRARFFERGATQAPYEFAFLAFAFF